LPLGALTLLIVAFRLHFPATEGSGWHKLQRVDYIGSVTLITATTLILLALQWGGTTYLWSSAIIVCLLIAGILLMAAFVLVETRLAKEPIIPPHLFKNWRITSVLFSNFFFGITFFGVEYYLPMFYQVVQGVNATHSGIAVIPFLLCVSLVAASTGQITSRFGGWIYRALTAGGLGLFAIACGLMSLFQAVPNHGLEISVQVFGGLSSGMTIQTSTLGLQSMVQSQDISVVTAVSIFSQVVGFVFGATILNAIENNSVEASLQPLINTGQLDGNVLQDFQLARQLPPYLQTIVVEAFSKAFHTMFLSLAPIAIVGMVLALALQVKIGGKERQRQAAAAENIPLDQSAFI